MLAVVAVWIDKIIVVMFVQTQTSPLPPPPPPPPHSQHHLNSLDDILQSHSISEIRHLVFELTNDANSKQGELQMMVGSTYHDFIQSADTISMMKKKSSSMNQELASFGDSVQDILKKSKNILQQSNLIHESSKTQPTPAKIPSLSSSSSSIGKNERIDDQPPPLLSPSLSSSCWQGDITELDSASIWMCLDHCDIFKACQILSLSEVVTAQDRSPSPLSDPSFPGDSSLFELLQLKACELIDPKQFKSPTSRSRSQLLSQCSSCAYLKQTVIDDSALLFLYGQCSIPEIAMAMAGLAGLDFVSRALSCGRESQEGSMTGKSLFVKYLNGVEMKLQSQLKQLSNSTLVDGRDNSSVPSLSTILTTSIDILQQAIFEAYTIFLQPISSPPSSSNLSEQTFLSGGLFGYYLRQFIQSLLPRNKSWNWNAIDELIHESVAPTIYLEVWFHWIRTQIETLQCCCKEAFSRINSPADVSKLQRLVSQSCLSSNIVHQIYQRNDSSSFVSPAPVNVGESSDPQVNLNNLWHASCSCLLETILTSRWNQIFHQFQTRVDHRHLAVSSTHNSSSLHEGGRMVWIYIFRQPFLSLVERLMKISCRDIFQTVKKTLLSILTDLSSLSHQSDQGAITKVKLSIDPLTLEMKYQTTQKQTKNSSFNSSSSSITTTLPLMPWGDQIDTLATSTELFVNAEKIRLYLENQMTTLMNDLLFTGDGEVSNNPDPDASYSLLRSLQIQSGELIGQILLLIRTLLSRYQQSLEQFKPLNQLDQFNSNQMPTKKLLPNSLLPIFEPHPLVPSQIQQNLLLNGVIFLSRLIWLFRSSSGDFLSRVLNSSTAHLKSLSRHQQYHYMTTIEQLLSAFDIADTDGDGFLNWDEALEAVEALWIDPNTILSGSGKSKTGEDKNEDDESSDLNKINYDFLWYDSSTLSSMNKLGLTFTLDEFRLVCSQMIAPPYHSSSTSSASLIEIPTACLQRSLESLLATSLSTFNLHILNTLRNSYQTTLTNLFPEHLLSLESSESISYSSSLDNEIREEFLASPQFRLKWRSRLATHEGDSSTESFELAEKITIPSCPTPALSHLLQCLGVLLNHTSLSIDTTHHLSDHISIPSQSFLPSPAKESIQVSCLWDYTKWIFYNSCHAMVEEELSSRHHSLSQSVDRHPKYQELVEEFSLQIIFDLHFLSSTIASETSSPPSTRPCYDLYYNDIDPVNVSFLLPFLEEECRNYLHQHHLLYPGTEKRWELNHFLIDNVGKGSSSSSSSSSSSGGAVTGQGRGKYDSQAEEIMKTIFASHSTSLGTEPSSGTGAGVKRDHPMPHPPQNNNTSSSSSSTMTMNRFPLLPLPIALTSSASTSSSLSSSLSSSSLPASGQRDPLGNKSKSSEAGLEIKSSSFSTPTRGLSSVFQGFKGW